MKGTVASIRNNLKDEVGMAGPNSTQTKFVGKIASIIHPYACFLSNCMGCRNKVTNHATINCT